MGSAHPVNSGQLVSRPYEEACQVITEVLPVTVITSYGRPPSVHQQQPAGSGSHGEDLSDGALDIPLVSACQKPKTLRRGSNDSMRWTDEFELSNDGLSNNRFSLDYADSYALNAVDFDASTASPTTAATRRKARRRREASSPQPDSTTASSGRSHPKQLPSADIRIPVFGSLSNHKAFLHPQVLDHLIPFISDSSLSTCLSVCPHWFRTIYGYLKKQCLPVIHSFRRQYRHYLHYENSTISIQPLFIAESAAVRIDLLIYCKVLPSCQHNCSQIGYSFSYKSTPVQRAPSPTKKPKRPSSPSGPSGGTWDDPLMSTRLTAADSPAQPGVIVSPPGRATSISSREFQAQFRFETLRNGAKRDLWLQRDMCRFHGDELMVAHLPNVPTVCVDDRLEVPVNVGNAVGLVDIESIGWMPLEFIPDPYRQFGQHCELERKTQLWVPLEQFQPTTNERLQNNDHFGPEWKHHKTVFTGIDITLSKSSYTAASPGEVPQSRRWLGIESIVKPAGVPIVCPLPRLGLQHDRFSRQQLRQGDRITLYISQGGGVLQ